jgi:hypothetical protein
MAMMQCRGRKKQIISAKMATDKIKTD